MMVGLTENENFQKSSIDIVCMHFFGNVKVVITLDHISLWIYAEEKKLRLGSSFSSELLVFFVLLLFVKVKPCLSISPEK